MKLETHLQINECFNFVDLSAFVVDTIIYIYIYIYISIIWPLLPRPGPVSIMAEHIWASQGNRQEGINSKGPRKDQ